MSFRRTFAVFLCFSCLILLYGLSSFVSNWSKVPNVHCAPKQIGIPKSSSMKSHGDDRIIPPKFFPQKEDKYFLYGEVLSKDHSFDRTNILSFRKTFFNVSGEDGFGDLIVDQNNTKIGSRLFYYFRPNITSYFEVTADFHKQLPEVADFGDLRRCTVVGNSGILANSSCGEGIDRSDFVFRCNAAPLKKFDKDAGQKSNLTSLNPSILNSRYGGIKKKKMLQQFVKDMQEYRGFLMASCFGNSKLIGVCLKAFYNYSSTKNIFAMAHPDYFRNMASICKRMGLTAVPSTGFYLTTAAIHFCEEVHLYGFWPFPVTSGFDSDAVPYHYFDNMKSPTELKKKTHNMDREFATLLRLHALGVIRLHVGNCS